MEREGVQLIVARAELIPSKFVSRKLNLAGLCTIGSELRWSGNQTREQDYRH